jgi:hypothetical protein
VLPGDRIYENLDIVLSDAFDRGSLAPCFRTDAGQLTDPGAPGNGKRLTHT